MFTLFLDTASHEGYAALCRDAQTLAVAKLPQHDEAAIIPAVETMLQQYGKTFEDLARCAAVTGPGGFTSMRTGIATINALAYALKIPSAGIHLSDLWRLRMKSNNTVRAKHASPQQPTYWFHSTRRTSLFIRSISNATYPEPTLIDIETAMEIKGYWIGELIDEHRRALTNLTPLDPSMMTSLEESLPEILTSLDYTNEQIEPWYGREG